MIDNQSEQFYLTTPGATQLTLMLSVAVSAARAFVNPIKAVWKKHDVKVDTIINNEHYTNLKVGNSMSC